MSSRIYRLSTRKIENLNGTLSWNMFYRTDFLLVTVEVFVLRPYEFSKILILQNSDIIRLLFSILEDRFRFIANNHNITKIITILFSKWKH